MSSGTSTDPARRRRLLVAGAAGLSVTAVAVALAIVYEGRFSFPMVFWILGWCSFLAAVAFLVQAATALDPAGAADLALEAVTDQRRAELEREKKILLKAIKEVEFDQAMGKIDRADADAIVARYRARAREVLKLLEGEKAEAEWVARAEEELRRRLESAPAVCAKCDTKNDADAEFCKKCGGKLR